MSEAAYSAAINAAGQAIGIAAQGAQNRALARLQNQYNIDMWNRTNEYNSPQAQMQRLSEAGLNPNLIYGSVQMGNATQPQMHAPEPVDFHKGISKIAEAFNIENLKTLHANRLKAEEEAKMAAINTANAKDERAGAYDFQSGFYFDPKTGSFVAVPETDDVSVELPASDDMKRLREITGSWSNRNYYYNLLRAKNYQNLHLIPYRASLLEHQRKFLVPQIQMARYEAKYKPWSYWIDSVNRGTGALKNLFMLPLPF